MRERIRNRPLLWLSVTAVVALFVGVAIGAGGATEETDTSDLEAQLTDAEDRLADAEDAVETLEDQLASAEEAREKAQARLRNLRAVEPAEEEPDDDTHTVGDFTFSDVQVREDGVGDFEVRARVTNNGDAAEFVRLEATLFDGGSVVADLQAIEDFDAGQTRTVTMISTDEFGEWDEVEFTVDVGF